jgi:hypothetical protein
MDLTPLNTNREYPIADPLPIPILNHTKDFPMPSGQRRLVDSATGLCYTVTIKSETDQREAPKWT